MLTTSADGSEYVWWLVAKVPGGVRSSAEVGGGAAPPRVAPVGVAGNTVNWLCEPPTAGAMLELTAH